MPNNYFQFKQFRVEQNLCAMKVSTDACIQGAIAAKSLKQPKTILDIGTGTGLLSLMMAQAFPNAQITALEIDTNAGKQAQDNFLHSKWNDRLQLQPISLQEFCRNPQKELFDAIISNPPFFSNHLLSHSENKMIARHDILLTQKELASSVSDLLNSTGKFCVMYPTNEWNKWEDIAQQAGLYVSKIYGIHPKKGKTPNRIIAIMSKKNTLSSAYSVFIRKNDGNYTEEFIELMQEWYLQ